MNAVAHLTLPQKLAYWAKTRPDAVALRQKEFGIWGPVSWREYAHHARCFGMGLMQLGLPAGAHVAVISENRQEWVYAELGCGMAGMVTVGVYATSPAPEVEYLLQTADVQAVVCEDQEQLDKVLEVRDRLPLLRHLIVMDPKGLRHYPVADRLSFAEVCELGARHEAERGAQIDERLRTQTADATALMIFTSGSTGQPKAAMISYGNINAMIEGTQHFYHCTDADSMLSYLPLCHVAEQIFTVYLPLASGATVNFAESLRTVQNDLREMAPTIFLGVPRIWEKMHASISIKLREAGPWRRALVERCFQAVEPFAQKSPAQWTLGQTWLYRLCHLLVFRALCNFLGLRRCRRALSGAAPIAPDLLGFFRTLGVEVTEGYGMTESAGLASIQRGRESALGTVGEPIPGLEVRIAEDGELLLRGPIVFQGYYRNPEASAQAIDADGWLHTGDIAVWVEPREAGQAREIKIVDRKKDIMITAGGKNISPSEIENLLKFSSYIKEAIIVADQRHFVSALIQIDGETAGKWAEEQGIAYTNFKSLAEHEAIRGLIWGVIEQVNSRMPQVQHVRKMHLLNKELDHDDGEVTATMKIRRKSIAQKYQAEIEAMYAA